MSTIENTKLSKENIAAYAYHLWESNGRQHGRDTEYWLQAEKHLKARATTAPDVKRDQNSSQSLPAPKKETTPAPTPKRKSENGSATRRQPAFA